MVDKNLYYTLKEYSDLIGKTSTTVRRWVKSDKLQAIKGDIGYGPQYLLPREQFDHAESIVEVFEKKSSYSFEDFSLNMALVLDKRDVSLQTNITKELNLVKTVVAEVFGDLNQEVEQLKEQNKLILEQNQRLIDLIEQKESSSFISNIFKSKKHSPK